MLFQRRHHLKYNNIRMQSAVTFRYRSMCPDSFAKSGCIAAAKGADRAEKQDMSEVVSTILCKFDKWVDVVAPSRPLLFSS